MFFPKIPFVEFAMNFVLFVATMPKSTKKIKIKHSCEVILLGLNILLFCEKYFHSKIFCHKPVQSFFFSILSSRGLSTGGMNKPHFGVVVRWLKI
jgi:hypothetical protein